MNVICFDVLPHTLRLPKQISARLSAIKKPPTLYQSVIPSKLMQTNGVSSTLIGFTMISSRYDISLNTFSSKMIFFFDRDMELVE